MNAHDIAPYLKVFVAGRPVSVNSMYALGNGRNKYTAKRKKPATIAWQQTVWYTVVASQAKGRKKPKLPLMVEIELYQLRANADPDNYCKATLDAVAGALGINDKHFTTVTVRRMPWVKGRTQGAMLTVWEA